MAQKGNKQREGKESIECECEENPRCQWPAPRLHCLSRDRSAMLLLLVAATVIANPGVAFAGESTSRYLPHLLDCTPAPTPSRNDSAFRANLAAALAVVTSGVAPEGSATVQSSSPDHRVFVRGICLSSSTGACPACLAAAAADLTSGCGASRRAGVWRDACFLAYADTDASTAREDAFRGWFNAGSDTTPALGDGECLLGTAARCIRCFDDALRAAPALGWLWRLRGGEVVVVSYTCYRRIKISVSPDGQMTMAKFWVWYMLVAEAILIGGLFCLIIMALVRELP